MFSIFRLRYFTIFAILKRVILQVFDFWIALFYKFSFFRLRYYTIFAIPKRVILQVFDF